MKTTLLALALPLLAQAALVTINPSPPIARPDGTLVNGRVNITSQAFINASGASIPAVRIFNRSVVNGIFVPAVSLEPNIGATPAGTVYTVTYTLQGSPTFTRLWYIPASPSTVLLSQVEFPVPGLVGTTAIVSPSQIVVPAGSTVGQTFCVLPGLFWGPGNCGTGITDPTTTRGDMIYRGAGGITRLALGTINFCLTSNGTDPVWAVCPGGTNQLTQDVLAGPGTGSQAATVVGINGVLLSGLATGVPKITTGTGAISIIGGSPTDCVLVNATSGACGSGGGSVFTGSTAVISLFSATPTLNLADVSAKSPVRFEPGALTGNVTAVTFTNKTAGAKFSIAWTQDGTGGRTVAYGAPTTNACVISPTAGITTTEEFEVAADGATVVGVGCTTTDAGAVFAGPESAAQATPPASTFTCWPDSTNHVWSCKANNSATVSNTVVPDTGASNNFLTGIGANGVITKAQPSAANLSDGNSGTGAICHATGSACATGGVSWTTTGTKIWSYQGWPFSPGAGAQTVTANTVYCLAMPIGEPGTVGRMWSSGYYSPLSGYVAFGFFDSAGNRLVSRNTNAYTSGAYVVTGYSQALAAGTLYYGCTAYDTSSSGGNNNPRGVLTVGDDSIGFVTGGTGGNQIFTCANAATGGGSGAFTLPATCGAKTDIVNAPWIGAMP